MAYLWTTTAEIQAYLDAESVISIGSGTDDTYTEADAIRLENAIVREVVSYLTPFYEITTLSVNTLLGDIVAKMTAAQIGLARFGASMGNALADWTYRLKNESWAALQRIAIGQSLSGETVAVVGAWKEVFGNGSGVGKTWTVNVELDTQPGDTSPAQYPGKLRFTFSEAVTLNALIAGTDAADSPIIETLYLVAETTETTSRYFKTVIGIDMSAAPVDDEVLLIEVNKTKAAGTIVAKTVALEQRLILAKVRERALIANV